MAFVFELTTLWRKLFSSLKRIFLWFFWVSSPTTPTVHTISRTEVLEGVAVDDLWQVSKQQEEILPTLAPEYFSKSSYVEGFAGQPGGIRVMKPGPAIPNGGEWKERLDFVDNDKKSCGYTIVEGDARYKKVSTVINCVGTGKSTTEVRWTCTYEPCGDAPAPEHMKQVFSMIFQTLAKAVKSRQIIAHTETFDAPPHAVWKAVHNLDKIVPKYYKDGVESSSNIAGQYYGKKGGIRRVKMGPGSPIKGEIWERLEFSDDATKTMAVSLLKGDPYYPYFYTVKVVGPGAVEGTTDASWTVSYIAAPNAPVPENHKQMYIKICKVIGQELKANPEPYM